MFLCAYWYVCLSVHVWVSVWVSKRQQNAVVIDCVSTCGFMCVCPLIYCFERMNVCGWAGVCVWTICSTIALFRDQNKLLHSGWSGVSQHQVRSHQRRRKAHWPVLLHCVWWDQWGERRDLKWNKVLLETITGSLDYCNHMGIPYNVIIRKTK